MTSIVLPTIIYTADYHRNPRAYKVLNEIHVAPIGTLVVYEYMQAAMRESAHE